MLVYSVSKSCREVRDILLVNCTALYKGGSIEITPTVPLKITSCVTVDTLNWRRKSIKEEEEREFILQPNIHFNSLFIYVESIHMN